MTHNWRDLKSQILDLESLITR